jgi:hypothetical protein
VLAADMGAGRAELIPQEVRQQQAWFGLALDPRTAPASAGRMRRRISEARR